ncbi:MAG: glycoside hydrolase family 88 protein [Bryobacterales bacterium]|nr:glycoside hydrolase family 88 protein [Bryobacterales bacterium]
MLPVILVIAGLDGTVEPFLAREVQRAPKSMAVTLFAPANPSKQTLVFPPTGNAYRDNAASHRIWRAIATTAPDLVLIAGPDPYGLQQALERESAAVGRIPVQRVEPKPGFLKSIKAVRQSEARLEMLRRLARTPKQVADQLEPIYGHELIDVVYIPAFSLIARLRTGHQSDVERIVAPYVTGAKDSLAKPTSSHFSGHLLFAELAQRSRKPEYIARVKAAADFAFTPEGQMKESMPLHSQMSDSVFMGCPILVQAGKLTADTKYFDMAAKHYRFMKRLDARPDGLWRHSPLDEAAWGRGNAFALLGMALALADLPASHEAHAEILRDYRSLSAALARHQQPSGMWRQVIDHPDAYLEFSATAMIARAMLTGVRQGWLPAKQYQPRIDKAWAAINARTSEKGELIDVCESTGAQKTLADYLNRKAILGTDPRGGAMVYLLAVDLLNP